MDSWLCICCCFLIFCESMDSLDFSWCCFLIFSSFWWTPVAALYAWRKMRSWPDWKLGLFVAFLPCRCWSFEEVLRPWKALCWWLVVLLCGGCRCLWSKRCGSGLFVWDLEFPCLQVGCWSETLHSGKICLKSLVIHYSFQKKKEKQNKLSIFHCLEIPTSVVSPVSFNQFSSLLFEVFYTW